MAYFPFYIDIENKNILVVGGGTVALRKIEKLSPFKPSITVVSPKICEEILKFNVKAIEREFDDNDLKGAFCVISATDNEKVNSHIFELCKKKNILVNTVKKKKKCGFIFPALACTKKFRYCRYYHIGQKSDICKVFKRAVFKYA